MKKTTKNYLKLGILLLGISFVLINCEKDPIPTLEDEHTHNSPFKVTRLTYDDIQYNVTVTNTLDELNTAISAAKSKTKSDDFDVYDFIIDTELVSYIEHQDGIHHSYTFPIIRDVDYGDLENLLLAYDEEAGYNAFLIKYEFTHEEKKAYFTGLDVDITGKIKVVELDIDNLNIDFRLKYVVCVDIITENCRAGKHPNENGYEGCTVYSSSVESSCVGGGGSGTGTGSGSGGDSGDGGSTGTGDPHGGGTGSSGGSTGGGSNITIPTLINKIGIKNCETLNGLLNTSGADISEVISTLKDKLNESTESGMSLKKSGGSYNATSIPTTGYESIEIPTGKKDPTIYGAVHTHPSTGHPMFSYRDVFLLCLLYDHATASNKSDATMMMMCKVGGVTKTYALKINNITLFRNKIYSMAGITASTPPDDVETKLDEMDIALQFKYEVLNPNYERIFLNYFKDFNISTYKADANGNNFEILYLVDPESSSSAVRGKPCDGTDII